MGFLDNRVLVFIHFETELVNYKIHKNWDTHHQQLGQLTKPIGANKYISPTMPAVYFFFNFLLYVTSLLWSCEGKSQQRLLLCCAVSVEAYAMKLSVQQTCKSVWLFSAHACGLLIQRRLSWALGLTMGRGQPERHLLQRVHSLWLEESKWSFVVPCHPVVTKRDHSSFSLSVSLGSSLVPYEVFVL